MKNINKQLLLLCVSLSMSLFKMNGQEINIKHKVASGETIAQIALKYQVTPSAILNLNPNASKGIKENEILLVPNLVKNKFTMKQLQIYILLFIIGLFLSGINPKDYFTWILEVSPAIIGLLILVFTYKKFQFTNFTYFFILIHCYILFLGGHYTYAEVPLFDWIKETFDQSRNNYDKVGHFAQGFVPAMITRELFIRKNVVANKNYFNFIH